MATPKWRMKDVSDHTGEETHGLHLYTAAWRTVQVQPDREESEGAAGGGLQAFVSPWGGQKEGRTAASHCGVQAAGLHRGTHQGGCAEPGVCQRADVDIRTQDGPP